MVLSSNCGVFGNTQLLCCRHLPKCFDNVHNLEFRKDEAGDPTKGAIGMYSGISSVQLSEVCIQTQP